MKISLNWLKDFIMLDESSVDLAHDLSMLGLAVDTVATVGPDEILELDITANRPDCLNHLGVARELSVAYGVPLRRPGVPTAPLPEVAAVPVEISIAGEDLCFRYCGLVIDGVRLQPSPQWLQERLEAVGQRPINNIVDITNYVLQELGHPLHAFDFRRLKQGRIIVRRARRGEKIETLDRQVRILTEEMLVIADAEDAVALAGVMGGAHSEVDEGSTSILLESAWFLPTSVRKTARQLGMNTEASYHFERGADLEMPPYALLRAATLMTELAGGEIVSPLIDVYPRRHQPPEITLRANQLRRLIGIDAIPDFVEKTLQRLEFQVVGYDDGAWRVRPPSFRVDVSLEADLIEEIARFQGYDRLPSTLPAFAAAPVTARLTRQRDRLRMYMRESGFQEILTNSFVSTRRDAEFSMDNRGANIPVDNPLAEEEPFFRANLLGGMVETLKFNENNFNQNVRLFEIGAAYRLEDEKINERHRLAVGAYGEYIVHKWMARNQPVDYFYLKGVIQGLLERLGVSGFTLAPGDDIAFLQPGHAAVFSVDGHVRGVFGLLNQKISRDWKFRQDILLGEVELNSFLSLPEPAFAFRHLSRFPQVTRDLSFTVDNKVSFGTIKRGLFGLKIPEIVDVKLLDLYKGEDVPQGRRALTVRLVFQDPQRTLTDREADTLRDRVTGFLVKEYEIRFR
ncbi:MAG: phenylalanine--tRNA ligase subunit beta [Acidobacteria bacterium]|nr:phenylalanine--tRNA ligase subunit beta [Acidobacteriota bacterium]